METSNQNTLTPGKSGNAPVDHNRRGRVFAGLFVVMIGVVFLLKRAGLDLPYWFFSFETLLIAVGLFIGVRHSFKGFVWAIPIAIGVILLADDIYPYYDFSDYFWPLIIIGVGLVIMFRSGRRHSDKYWKNWETANASKQNLGDDFLDSTVFFGGVKKNIISKNFRGGDATTVFGGTEINLTQADVNGRIVLDLTQIFGGTKLIVPPHWKIQSQDLVAIFGGVEDKRPILSDPSTVDPNKVLVLEGTCIFGGIDIKSY
jgi:hypothetical protein